MKKTQKKPNGFENETEKNPSLSKMAKNETEKNQSKVKYSKVNKSKVNINYTTLNYLFNLIINNNACAKEINLSESEFDGFKLLLKRLDILLSDESIKYISDEERLRFMIIYHVLLELYKSSFKVFLSSLTYGKLMHKYVKTQEYVGTPHKEDVEIDNFISYFIKCLQEELKE